LLFSLDTFQSLLGDARLIGVGASSFARGLLAAAQTLREPLLLVGFTIVDGVWLDRVAVVVVVVYLPARGVLFTVYLLLFLIGRPGRAAPGARAER
jgi:hypothetical protein